LIPPNLHYVKPNPTIPALIEGRLRVVSDAEKLDGPLISVNSFGFGGTNAHALFKGVSQSKINFGIPLDNVPRLVVWSGRTEDAVNSMIESVTLKPLDAEYIGLLHNIQVESLSTNIYRGFATYSQSGVEVNYWKLEQKKPGSILSPTGSRKLVYLEFLCGGS
jgi:fatty acid synthase, animal type